MRIIIGCERSGTVREAFRAKGHDAWSCDLRPSDQPGNHIQGDIFDAIKDHWDMAIFHPPCTFLANSGSQWLSHPEDKHLPIDERRPNPFYPTRREDQKKAIAFFRRLWLSPINKICMENPKPMGVLMQEVGRYTQIIEPFFFGDSFKKPTCLWLKNLPALIPTNMVSPGEFVTFSSGKKHPKWYNEAKKGNKELTQTIRSKTFPGMALAMADQWK